MKPSRSPRYFRGIEVDQVRPVTQPGVPDKILLSLVVWYNDMRRQVANLEEVDRHRARPAPARRCRPGGLSLAAESAGTRRASRPAQPPRHAGQAAARPTSRAARRSAPLCRRSRRVVTHFMASRFSIASPAIRDIETDLDSIAAKAGVKTSGFSFQAKGTQGPRSHRNFH